MVGKSTFRLQPEYTQHFGGYMLEIRRSFALFVAVLLVLTSSVSAIPGWRVQDASSQQKLSKGFMDAATTALVSIHTAKQNILNIVQNNLPSGYYNPRLATTAYEQMRQAQIAATTDGDQQAAALLDSYWQKVKAWADKYKEARQSMNATDTMNKNDIAQDPDLQAIDACEKGFNNMLISRVYNEIPSCQ